MKKLSTNGELRYGIACGNAEVEMFPDDFNEVGWSTEAVQALETVK